MGSAEPSSSAKYPGGFHRGANARKMPRAGEGLDVKQTLGKDDRVHREKDLSRIMQEGKMLGDRRIRLHVLANGLGRSRMAVFVGLRHGSAVRRNRIKRLCREAFRLTRQELPAGYDYILRPHSSAKFTLVELQQSLRKLSRALIPEVPT